MSEMNQAVTTPAADADLLEALKPFLRTTLLSGSEDEGRAVLMPLYPKHIRGIQKYLGVHAGYPKPAPSPIICPNCGSSNVAVARDMKATRRCSKCQHSWLPNQDPVALATTPARNTSQIGEG